jgi:hypothetical protein
MDQILDQKIRNRKLITQKKEFKILIFSLKRFAGFTDKKEYFPEPILLKVFCKNCEKNSFDLLKI